ncbi:MAG: hypothetical protein FWH19_04145 [Treponema sp.]|nr:hypothetical protein [Treponema sp.]
MTKNRFFSFAPLVFPALLLALLLFSCRSAPSVEEELPDDYHALMPGLDELYTDFEWEEGLLWPEDLLEEFLEEDLDGDRPSVVFPPEDRPVQTELLLELPEPGLPEFPPAQEETAPEPLEPAVTPPEDPGPAPAPPTDPPPGVPAQPADQPPAADPAPPREIPPQPPAFLAPPEPELPSPPVREPEPAPPPQAVPPSTPGFPPAERPGDEPFISRIIRVTVGQFLEIPFSGTGWVYLGEQENRRGISYHSRRLDTEGGATLGQSFIFQAEAVGTYILRFSRQDFIQDYIINDLVQVIVEERRDDPDAPPLVEQGRVIAEPRWPPPLGSVAETQGPSEELEPGTDPDGIALEGPAEDAQAEQLRLGSQAEYLSLARGELDAGSIERGLALMDSMRVHYPLETDEVLWLYAQLYEANSPSRDIRLSVEYYRRLVREYPQSNWVGPAQRRIAYLERFFFNIR